MKLNDHKDITVFNIVFNKSIDIKAELNMKLTSRDDEIFYIILVNLVFPIWLKR